MSKGYKMIADGLKMMAKGYELLANSEAVVAEADVNSAVEEVKVPDISKKADSEEATVKVTDVRAVMRQKIKDGKMEECQEIIHSFGCEKLTDVPKEKLAELLSKVEVL